LGSVTFLRVFAGAGLQPLAANFPAIQETAGQEMYSFRMKKTNDHKKLSSPKYCTTDIQARENRRQLITAR